jgi:hypothetical protein
VPLSVFTSIERDRSENVVTTETTPKVNSVHKSNESFLRKRVSLGVVSSIESDCSEQVGMT